MSRGVKLAAVGVLLVGGLTGCTSNHVSDNDSKTQPTGPATVIQFPHGFRNVAFKCDGPNMVYSLSAGTSDTYPGGLAVVPDDPRCK